jgi:hypothetical protein
MKPKKNKYYVIQLVYEHLKSTQWATDQDAGRVKNYEVEEILLGNEAHKVTRRSSKVGLIHKRKPRV